MDQTLLLLLITLVSGLVGLIYGFYAATTGRHGLLRVDYKWAIGVYSGQNPFNLIPAPGVKNPVLEVRHVRDVKACLIADPFLIRQGNLWHLFFEVVAAATRRGSIGLAQSPDGLHWQYQRIVLSEPFHLSYPYLFHWKSSTYLVPETESQQSVRLYAAEDFPFRWKFVQPLLTGRPFHDPSLFFHQGSWWMLVGIGAKSDTLCLFQADDLLGPWREHPRSPIVQANPHGARPGGRVLVVGDRIIRFAQETCPYYGKGLRAFEIIRLTPQEYQEREIPLPISDPKKDRGAWNSYGMHHLDIQPTTEGRWLACADGQKRVLAPSFWK